ncbi:MAG: sugar phosphate isomerase/epimerase [Pirellulales bacterium]
MRLGIFAKTFARPTLEATLGAVRSCGLNVVQFNLSCAGLPTLPDELSAERAGAIGRAVQGHGIGMAAISGTFNMIHPDLAQRQAGLARLAVLAAACGPLGTKLITLCTGTRDPADMWRRHSDNGSPAAWRDLLESMRQAVRIAEEHDITLGVEPEISNVIDSARQARRLLDELASPRVKIVIDAANLFHAGELARMAEVLDEAFDLLGPDIALAHAKDLVRGGEAGDQAAGSGLLDYRRYLGLLSQAHYGGPLILHGLTEAEVPQTIQRMRDLGVSG